MAQLFIQIDKPYYFAGDTVNGMVFMNLFQNMNARQVMIKFKGWESVRWIEEQNVSEQERQQLQHHLIWKKAIYVHMDSSDSQDSGKEGEDQFMRYNYVQRHGQLKRISRYSGGREISKFATKLYDFGGSFIPAGQYSFPFSFKTGQNYPASYSQKANDRSRKGRIKYEMQAFVKGDKVARRLLKYKTQIVLRESIPIKNDKQQMVAHVKSCCCIDKGISKIQCYFQKNGYSPGEDANIHCVLDTKASKADVTSVDVSFINKVTYTSRENHSRQFYETLFKVSFPGLGMGNEVERTQTVKILNEKSSDRTNIKPTARGVKLQSVYFLKVQAVLNASCTCCSQLPVVYQSILIYPYIPVNYIFNAPPNWHPTQMSMMNLSVPINTDNTNLKMMSNPYY